MTRRAVHALALLTALALTLGCFYPMPEPGRGREHSRERLPEHRLPERDLPR